MQFAAGDQSGPQEQIGCDDSFSQRVSASEVGHGA
jgi:hypothetical protein